MTFRSASKLHNGDEVIRKDNNESLRVISIVVSKGLTINRVLIEAQGDKSGHVKLYHTDVR